MASLTKTLRIAVPDTATHTIVDFAKNVRIRNAGLVDVKFRFDDDDESDYWTIIPGAIGPEIGVIGGETIHFSAASSTTVEMLIWG